MRRQERQAKRAHTKRCHKSSPRSKAGKAAQNDEPGCMQRDVRDAVCPLWSLPYEEQLSMKFNKVQDALNILARGVIKKCRRERAGGGYATLPKWTLTRKGQSENPVQLSGIVRSPVLDGYRNKSEFTVGLDTDGERSVGFNVGLFRDGVTAVSSPQDCRNISPIAKCIATAFQLFLRSEARDSLESGSCLLPAWDKRRAVGFWRLLTVREGGFAPKSGSWSDWVRHFPSAEMITKDDNTYSSSDKALVSSEEKIIASSHDQAASPKSKSGCHFHPPRATNTISTSTRDPTYNNIITYRRNPKKLLLMMSTSLSKPAIIVAGILSIMAILTEAWLPSSNHHTVIKNTRGQRHPFINHNIHVESTNIMVAPTHSSSITRTSLFKYIETDPDTPPIIELDSEQDQALRDSWPAMEEAYGIDWFQQSEAWEDMKIKYPSLQQFTNEELEKAFVAQKPTVIDIFTKTPLGPFLALNGVFWLAGFSWCDTPFHGADACLP